ncbi:hypothetical protein ERK18_04845 [Lactobacillus kimbladii]|uniref:hypothetical protein n=1 Tax=Lactobacillus kimbladii TaxID=1218506 RepID=UPI00164F6BC5|nr:hypothetical protein [Lactobacillus kimbladii]MBC6342354.1 hypothetical protein [Lactobacillus kimbladii]
MISKKAVAIRSFFHGMIFQKIIGVVLIVLTVFEIISGYKYTSNILRQGTNNGFSFLFGLVLLIGGFICLFEQF